jgi:hypothetical protein
MKLSPLPLILIHSIAHFDLPRKRYVVARSVDLLCDNNNIATQGSFVYKANESYGNGTNHSTRTNPPGHRAHRRARREKANNRIEEACLFDHLN